MAKNCTRYDHSIINNSVFKGGPGVGFEGVGIGMPAQLSPDGVANGHHKLPIQAQVCTQGSF